MIVITKTTIGFKMPEEYKQALKFGEERWIKQWNCGMVGYESNRII